MNTQPITHLIDGSTVGPFIVLDGDSRRVCIRIFSDVIYGFGFGWTPRATIAEMDFIWQTSSNFELTGGDFGSYLTGPFYMQIQVPAPGTIYLTEISLVR